MTQDLTAPSLLRSVGLMADGPAVWGRPVQAQGPGVFVVELPAPLASAPIELTRVGKWIERVPSLTMDGERRVYPDGAIAVRDKRIVAIGPTRLIEETWRATRRIDAAGGAVHPGFIDGHYHPNLHLTRGALSDNPKKPMDEGGSPDFPEWLNALTDLKANDAASTASRASCWAARSLSAITN